MSDSNSMHFDSAMIGLIIIGLLIACVYFLTVGTHPELESAKAAFDPDKVAERLKPIGVVNVAGSAQEKAPADTGAPAAAVAQVAAGGSRGGEEVYNKACFACHLAGAAGAPKLGDQAAWEPRVALGLDALLASVVNGKNAMPPRGTCIDCSDDELKAAIEFMLSKLQ